MSYKLLKIPPSRWNTPKIHPEFHLFSLQEYIDLLIRFLERLRPGVAIDRLINQSPKEMLIAPSWGLKNFEVMQMVEKRLAALDTWQGRLYCPARGI
ncbi:MAG: hypothetical protein U5K79_00440 [Cyclobacteriaceae bacterium]|nr:hypothetical protein [Cyclobacteriaceae bacterium]